MASDNDWVEDVRRWYLSGQGRAPEATADGADEGYGLGVEAAHPALQSAHWPDAPQRLAAPAA